MPARTNRSGQLNRQAAGAHWENRARQWLERQGLRFVAANVRERCGEIDLIMRQQHVTVFVEVRYRKSSLFGGAAASVTRNKQQKLLQTARLWLPPSFDTVDCRFDVLAFTGNEIEWIVDAFSSHS
nr:YraN family protein [Franconibacter pulveris]